MVLSHINWKHDNPISSNCWMVKIIGSKKLHNFLCFRFRQNYQYFGSCWWGRIMLRALATFTECYFLPGLSLIGLTGWFWSESCSSDSVYRQPCNILHTEVSIPGHEDNIQTHPAEPGPVWRPVLPPGHHHLLPPLPLLPLEGLDHAPPPPLHHTRSTPVKCTAVYYRSEFSCFEKYVSCL